MERCRQRSPKMSFPGRRLALGFTILLLLTTTLVARERWVYRYDGSSHDEDDGMAIVYGLDGYVYAAGCANYTDTNTDLVVISLSPAGDTMWLFRYDGPGGQWDGAYCLDYGEDYNLYVGGNSSTTDTTQAFTVMSLSSTGDTNWIYARDAGYFADVAFAITRGSDGNIYAAGRTRCNYFGSALAVVSLSAAGDTNWVYEWDASVSSYDYAGSIVYGADGNIYAAGSGGPDFTNADLIVVSLTSAAGDTNWMYSWAGPTDNWDGATSLAWGLDGNIYAAGYTYVTGMDHDMVVVSLDTLGDTNWVYRYDGPANSYDRARSIVYGQDGNLYVAGESHGIGSEADFVVLSLTTSGDTNWIFRYDGPAGEYDGANSVVYGSDGNLYAAGYSRDTSGDSDLAIICLTTQGELNWVYTYSGPGASHDGAESVVYGDGNVYAVGTSYGGTTDDDFAVVSVSGDLDPPSVPELISPDSGSILGDASVTMLWRSSQDPGSGIAEYTLQHSTNSSFAGADSIVIIDTSYLEVLSDTTHYWRVKAEDSVGYESAWSTTWHFNVDTEAPQISNTTAWEDTTFTGPFPVYSTMTDNSGVLDAQLLYRVLGSPLWIVLAMDTAGAPGGQHMAEIPAHTANTTIQYFVQCRDIALPPNTTVDPEGAPDTSYSFVILPTGLLETTVPTNHRWFLSKNHPNPFTESTQLWYGLAKDGRMRATIYNSSGQEVRILVDSERAAGTYTVLWDGRDDSGDRVPSGFYFLKLQAGTRQDEATYTAVRKLCLMR